jgi:hypothetical protein
VRVIELGGDTDLVQKPLGAECRGELGSENLHRNLAVVLEILGEVDGGHAAGAEFTLDLVAIGESL